MEKRIKYSQFQQVKSAAKMIDPLKRKMAPLEKKIKELANEYKGYQTQIDALEAGIVQVIGFHVDELVKKVIEPTGAVDKAGKPVMVTKYLPTDMVTYDEKTKEYVIKTLDAETPESEEEIESFQEDAGNTVEEQSKEVPEASEVADEPADEPSSELPWE